MDTWTQTHRDPFTCRPPAGGSGRPQVKQTPKSLRLTTPIIGPKDSQFQTRRDKKQLPSPMSYPLPHCFLWGDPILPHSYSQLLGKGEGPRSPAQVGGNLVSCRTGKDDTGLRLGQSWVLSTLRKYQPLKTWRPTHGPHVVP